jgi:hypothetical protein
MQPQTILSSTGLFPEASTLELMIAVTQFGAVVFCTKGGIALIWQNYFRYIALSNHRTVCKKVAFPTKAVDGKMVASPSIGAEYIVVEEALEKARRQALLDIFMGFWEIVFGIAFLFLTANSLHLHGPTHPKPLIDALIWMEVGLGYVLVLMWQKYQARNAFSIRAQKLALMLQISPPKSAPDVLFKITEAGYDTVSEGLIDMIPALDFTLDDSGEGLEALVLEKMKIARDGLSKVTAYRNTRSKVSVEALTAQLNDVAANENSGASWDLFYFVINFIAGYGYLLGILAFYCPASPDESIVSKSLKFGHFGVSDDAADFWGNFSGDFAWTLEPFFILFGQTLVAKLAQKKVVKKKVE